MDDNGRVLAIAAHPDDVEIGCAGTLARLANRGYRVTICTVSRGDCGSAELPKDEIAAIRHAEAEKSAAIIGADYRCLGYDDVTVCFDLPTRKKVVSVIRQVNPFMVFTQPDCDYMYDHIVTSHLVMDATFNASIPNWETDDPSDPGPSDGLPYLYYVPPMEGIDKYGRRWPVGFYVDVEETFRTKVEMLSCHESQRSWLYRQHGMDHYVESMRHWTESLGEQACVRYAEAFAQHLGHPYPKDNVLDGVLGILSAKVAP